MPPARRFAKLELQRNPGRESSRFATCASLLRIIRAFAAPIFCLPPPTSTLFPLPPSTSPPPSQFLNTYFPAAFFASSARSVAIASISTFFIIQKSSSRTYDFDRFTSPICASGALHFSPCLDILLALARAMVWILYWLSFDSSRISLSLWSPALATIIMAATTLVNQFNLSSLITINLWFRHPFLHLRQWVNNLTIARRS